MSPLTDYFTIRAALLIFGVLGLVYTVLIIYTVVIRYIQNQRLKKYVDSEGYMLPLIYEYLEGTISREDFVDAMRNRIDIITAFRNIDTMIENIKGEERTKLKNLLELPQFKSYFLKKLKSRSTIELAESCVYFEKKNYTDTSVLTKLSRLQKHSYSVLAYSATLALINSNNQEIRDLALRIFLRRKNNASMAIGDIIFKYYSKHESKEIAAESLMEIVSSKQLPYSSAAAVLRMFPELGFYQLGESVLDLLKSTSVSYKTVLFLKTVIHVLNELSVPGTDEELMSREFWDSEYQPLRMITAYWTMNHYSENWELVLLRLSGDSDVEVRMVAQMAILNSGDLDRLEPAIPKKYKQEWHQIKQSGEFLLNVY